VCDCRVCIVRRHKGFCPFFRGEGFACALVRAALWTEGKKKVLEPVRDEAVPSAFPLVSIPSLVSILNRLHPRHCPPSSVAFVA